MTHMVRRAATAAGSVKNTGNVTVSYQVRLRLDLHLPDRRPAPADILDPDTGFLLANYAEAVQAITLGPGQSSPALTLSAGLDLPADYWIFAKVILDIMAPRSIPGFRTAAVAEYQEAVIIGGELVGFGPAISGVRDQAQAPRSSHRDASLTSGV